MRQLLAGLSRVQRGMSPHSGVSQVPRALPVGLHRVGGLRGREIGELFRVGDRSVSQGRKRLRDRLSDDRNTQDLFKGLPGKCNN
jgi:hypothetical protein